MEIDGKKVEVHELTLGDWLTFQQAENVPFLAVIAKCVTLDGEWLSEAQWQEMPMRHGPALLAEIAAKNGLGEGDDPLASGGSSQDSPSDSAPFHLRFGQSR